MRIIGTCTDDTWGLVEEEEFISLDESLKAIFVEFGWAKPYDDTKPLPPKGMNDYELGMVYPANRHIIYSGSLYKSNTTTSTTWVPAEWDIKIQGV